MSSIQEFYANQTIFIIGATGFVGKLIVEKLLRSCYDVEKIYILVRSKRDRTEEERLKNIFEQRCFDVVHSLRPHFHEKIHLVSGDCSQPDLGLDETVREVLKNEVTCVIHAAANVRFDVDLKTAVETNVRSVRDLLRLAEETRPLKAFVYVSTAFSHCVRQRIDEEFYDVDIDPEKLLKLVEIVDGKTLEVMTPHLLGKWPNTYVYTKAVAEQLIRTYKRVLPVAIVRPAIVTSTYESPVPGWIENFSGIVGVVIGIALGVLRTLHIDTSLRAQIVPADHVVNSVLAVAWAVERGKYETKNETIPIYNVTGPNENSITWGDLSDELVKFIFKYPLSSSIWYYYYKTSCHKCIHKIRVFFLHTLFSYLVDGIMLAIGKRPLAIEKYKKIDKLIDVLAFFTTNQWQFLHQNVDALWEKMGENDRKIFDFDGRNLKWSKYFESAAIGGRIYLMKDPLETLPQAKKKMYTLATIHYLFVALVAYLLYCILRLLWNVVM